MPTPSTRLLRHSPSLRAQSKGCGKVFFLGGRWGVRVGCGVVGRVINGAAQAPFDVPAGPVVWHVDVPWLRVVAVIARGRGGDLVFGKGNGMGLKVPEGV